MRNPGWIPPLAAACLALTGCASGPSVSEISHQIRAIEDSPHVAGETIVERGALTRFYKMRDARPAWLDHADDVVTTIRGMEADGLDPADYHLSAIEAFQAEIAATAAGNLIEDFRVGRG